MLKRPTLTRNLLSKCNLGSLEDESLEDEMVDGLRMAVFCDQRWQNGLRHLAESETWTNDEEKVKALIQRGARAFGFWHLPEAVLKTLTRHLLGEEPSVSPALDSWMNRVNSEGRQAGRASTVSFNVSFNDRKASHASLKAKGHQSQSRGSDNKKTKLIIIFIVFLLSNLYAVEVVCVMYPGIVELFGVPIYFARAGAAGTLLWTALLFLSMAKNLHKALARITPYNGRLIRILEQHKEIHIFSGQMLVATVVLHVVSHFIGTMPGIISLPLEKLNAVLGCANPDDTPLYLGVSIPWLMMPACPLTERATYLGVLFRTTPGLSGLALLLVSALIWYTANESRRKANFELFMYVHNAAMPMWLILLFVHGSNGWVGVGFPLVVFVCTIPVLFYLVDRVLRLLRYYLFTGRSVELVDVVIRPGANKKAKGSLINLKLSKPPFLWDAREGMYGMLCMPEYSAYQWHPFTICSAKQDETVDFIVTACGDWTCDLAERCLAAQKGDGNLPKLALDGPYLAPTVSALSQEVLIAVGAGVGITPFLSLLSALISMLSDEKKRHKVGVKEAHFFWMTRSADELLFGRKHFTRIASHSYLRDRIFLHLHVTQKESDRDVAAFMFREAVKRQSSVDRVVFDQVANNCHSVRDVAAGVQLPWNWVHGAKEDVLWVSCLLEVADDEAEKVANAHGHHWSQGVHLMRQQWSSSSKPQGLFRHSISCLSSASSDTGGDVSSGSRSSYMPVVFGRPNFSREILAIGKARPEHDAHVYVCGNDMLVQSLRGVCDLCDGHLRQDAEANGREARKFYLHYERFG